jgi:peptide/nickel transport system substrate-binding protein
MITRRQFNWGLTASAGAAALSQGAAPAFAQKKGGDAVMAQQAQPPSLDAMTTTAQASRNINLHMWETLFARDEAANPKPDLATGVEVAPDGLTYTFKLRQGVRFHNGKEMSAADVKASLERYAKLGGSAFIMRPVDRIETPDKATVVCKMKSVYPGFIEGLSSPRAPAVVMPEEECVKEANKITPIGTGPYQFVEYKPDSHVKLRRFDNYSQNTAYTQRDGFAGKKTSYFDTLTIRFMPEAGARTAALQAGEVHFLEALAVPAAKRLKDNKDVRTYEMMPWAFQTLIVNNLLAPTDNVMVRRAIQAALDMEEIMAISTDGLFRLTHGWQHPGTAHFAGDVGKNLYNMRDEARAKKLLQDGGYKGEELVILTDSSFSNHKATGEVAAEQLRKVGIKVKLNVVDWPTATNLRTRKEGWNLWCLMFGIEPYEGPYGVVGFFSGQNPGQLGQDPEIEKAQAQLTSSLKIEDRIAAMRNFQQRMYEQVISIKCGDVGIVQATRANVQNYRPYRIPRMWDCSFA